MTQLEKNLRRAIANLILGDVDLRAFATIVAQVIDAAGAVDPVAHDLALEVELRLAEYSNGDWSLDELMSLLRPIVTSYSVTLPGTPIIGSDTRLTTSGGSARSVSVAKLSAVVSA